MRDRRLSTAIRFGVEALERRDLFAVSMDANGWTVVTPSADTRTIYVSTSGNDNNDGLSPTTPLATITKARTLVRSGFPDWILLRRGDVFTGQRFQQWNTSGRNASEPFVIGAYTDPAAPSNARPQLNTGIATGLSFTTTAPASHVYVMGIAFEAHRRDFRDAPADFTTAWNTDANGGTYGVNASAPVNNVVIEDCSFQYYKGGLVIQNNASNVTVRRSVVADSWAQNVDQFGNQMGFDTAANGVYADLVTNLTLDQNVFSHNGWVESNSLFARQNIYSHNLYLNSGNNNVSVTNNIIADGASHGLQMRAGGLVKGNLFLRNPIAMSYGYVNGSNGKSGGVSGEISDNVVVGSAKIFDSTRGWGIEIANLRPASTGGGTVIRNNVFANDNQNTNPAIKLDLPNGAEVGINDLLIEQNIVYSWFKGLSIHSAYSASGAKPLKNLIVRQNDFQRISTSATIIDINGTSIDATQHTWTNNRYDSLNADPNAVLFRGGGANHTLAQWQTFLEPTAIRAQGLFPDPGRTAGGYNASLGGVNNVDEFIRQAMRNSKAFWRTQYTADPANDWIRAGYSGGRVDVAAPTGSAVADNITISGGTTQTISVNWSDDNRIDLATVGDGDLRVTGPNGYSAIATLVSSSGPADGRKRSATYTIAAPASGSWSAAANGLYTISVETAALKDAAGRSANADPIGTFSVTIDPAVPAAVATAPAVVNNSGQVAVSVTYTGAISSALPTSVAPLNAGFEAPNVAAEGSGYVYAPTGGSWTFEGPAGVTIDNTPYTSGNLPAPQGTQVAFLQMSSAIRQTVPNWLAGTYRLSLKAAQRANWGTPTHDFQVLIDGVVVATMQPTGYSYETYTTPEFTVAAGEHTVELRGLNTVGGDQTSLIDDVQIVGSTTPTQQVISAASFDGSDIRLTGAAGFVATPSTTLPSDATDGNQRTVVYTFNAPAGGWKAAGTTLSVQAAAQQVTTTSGVAVPAGKIGSVAVGVSSPTVLAVGAPDVVAAGTAAQVFTVSYADNNPGSALAASIDSLDLVVDGPAGYRVAAALVSMTGAGTTASPLVATYSVPAPAAGWGSATNGTYFITAQAGQVTDADGNSLPAGVIGLFRVGVDTTPPIAAAVEDNITTQLLDSKSIGVAYYDVSGFAANTFDSADIRVTGPNGFSSSVLMTNGSSSSDAAFANYLLTAPNGKWQSYHNGTYSVVVQPGQVFDAVGNAITTPVTIATFTVAIETTPPTVSVFAPSPNPRNSAVSSLTIAFSELVSGVDLADLSLSFNGGAVSLAGATLTTADNTTFTIGNLTGLTGSAGTYALSVNAAGSGIIDNAGNALAVGGSTSWTVDLTKPGAAATAGSITAPTTLAHSINVTYTDNLDVSTATIDGSDLRVIGPNGFNSAVSLVSVNGSVGNRAAVYGLPAPVGGWKSSHNGTYSIVLQSTQVADTAGNFADSATIGSFTVALETTPPTVAIPAVSPNPRSSPLTSISLNFSEAVVGFDLADLSLTRNGTPVSLASATLTATSPTTYTLDNLSSATGTTGSYTLTLNAASSGIADAAGNALSAGAAVSWTTDATAPAASATATDITTSAATVVINASFSDASDVSVASLDSSDIQITGPNGFVAPASLVSVGGTAGTRTAVYSVAAPVGGWKSFQNGVYSIVVQAGQVLDTLGNAAAAGTIGTFNVAIETTPPTVSLGTVASPRSGPLASLGVTFSEAVTGFDLSDVTVTRNGLPVSLAGASISGSGAAYSIDGMAGATADAGPYQISIAAPAGITDAAGNALSAGATVSFTVTGEAVVTPDLGFESPAVPGEYVYSPGGSAWTFAGLAGLTGNASAYTSANPNAPEGSQVALLQMSGRFAQTISNWAAGRYVLTFQAAQRGNHGTRFHDFSVLIDGQVVATVQPSSTTYEVYQTSPFNVAAGSHTIEFRGLNTFGGDQTSLIDNVAIVRQVTPPAVVSIAPSPAQGSVFRQQLTISGTDFADDSAVVIRRQDTGQPLADVSVISRSATQIVLSARLGDAGGVYLAEVSGGTGSASPVAFSVSAAPAITATGSVATNGLSATVGLTGVLGSGVNYAWRVASGPAGATFPTGNTAATATVNFAAVGQYAIEVTASDGVASVVRTVNLTVTQVLSALALSPTSATVAAGAQQPFTATATDQFGAAMTVPTLAWSLTGVGTVSAAGVYTAPATGGGTATVRAASGSIAATASVTAQAPAVTSVAKIDFTTSGATLATGYLRDSGQTYAARNGLTYGWTVSHTANVFDRNKNSNQLLDTTLLTKASAKWELAVPNGTYTVLVGVGDSGGASNNNIWIEGKQLFNYVAKAANAFEARSISVTVTDGKLTLTNGGAANQTTRITHLEVTRTTVPPASPPTSPPSSPPTSPPSSPPTSPPPPTTTGVKIDFAPAAAPAVAGYLVDSGQVYGSRGNGQTYGWTVSHTDVVFDRDVNADQRLDTVLAVKAGQKWNLAVANGTYNVTVVAGDPTTPTANNIWIEGIWTAQYATAEPNVFVSRNLTVTVADGSLTLTIGGAPDLGTRLAYIEVVKV